MTGTPPDAVAGRAPPVAGGLPIGEATARQAAEWLTLLMSGEASDTDRARWQQWRQAHPDHERAWRHIEAVTGRLKALQPQAAYQALSPHAAPEAIDPRRRRIARRALCWVGGAGVVGLVASRTQSWQQLAADHRTGTGERRSVTLADGTVVLLNTGSALQVRFDAQRRGVRLVAGEVLIVTGHATADPRPFVVETAEGGIRALGTRFVVRQWPHRTQVSVLDSAVEIRPGDAVGRSRVVRAGDQAWFTRDAIEAPLAAGLQAAAWTRGQIVADDLRLDDFVAELGRYRPGIVRCAPGVAGLRLSGVFPLQDTDRILATLPSVLPVQVTLRTRYWVTVEAAQ